MRFLSEPHEIVSSVRNREHHDGVANRQSNFPQHMYCAKLHFIVRVRLPRSIVT